MQPACPNQKQNHLQNSLLRQTQFWVRKTFSKPASLKRVSLVAHSDTCRIFSHPAVLVPKFPAKQPLTFQFQSPISSQHTHLGMFCQHLNDCNLKLSQQSQNHWPGCSFFPQQTCIFLPHSFFCLKHAFFHLMYFFRIVAGFSLQAFHVSKKKCVCLSKSDR